MKPTTNHTVPTVLGILLAGIPGAARGDVVLGTGFTYQGQLRNDGAPLDGTADLRFTLFNSASGGAAIGASQTRAAEPVGRGLFSVELDFGQDAFDGNARWLQIEVRVPPGVGSYITLTPRQPILPTPYARCAAVAEDLELPFSGSANSAAATVNLSNSGTGRAASFQTSSATNNAATVYSEQSGLGRAGHFRITNAANTLEGVAASTTGSGPALSGYTIGSAPAVKGLTDGSGSAGYFEIHNPTNDARALEVTTNGTGGAASFTTTNPTGDASAVYAEQNGLGRAGYFTVNNTNNVLQAVFASTTGSGSAVRAYTSGTGPAANVEAINPANASDALEVSTAGTGNAASFATSNTANASATVLAEQSGLGRGGEFKIDNSSNASHAVFASTNGTGYGVSAEAPTRGVYGKATQTTGVTRGVVGDTLSTTGRGIQGYASTATGANYGVWGGSNSADGIGTHGTNVRTSKSGSLGGPDYGVRSDGDLIVENGALHVTSASDVAPGGGGSVVIGPTTGYNIAVDNNEIMARNNGATASLYLNNDGGDVVVGGAIDIGYEIVTAVTTSDDAVVVQCPAGKKVIAAGCACSFQEIRASYPRQGGAEWLCSCGGSYAEAHAVCAKVK